VEKIPSGISVITQESGKNTIRNMCDNTEESEKNTNGIFSRLF
jgi:hypothetical protein